jgi:hypothetical protein
VTDQTRESVEAWIAKARLGPEPFLFPSRRPGSPPLSTRQYSRIVNGCAAMIRLDPQH